MSRNDNSLLYVTLKLFELIPQKDITMLWVFVLSFLTAVNAELIPVLKNEDSIPNQYIIILKSDVDVTAFVHLVALSVSTSPHPERFLLRKIIDRKLLKAAIFNLEDENLQKIRRLPGIKYIEEDGFYSIAKGAKSWGQDRIDQRSGTNGYFTLNSWGANQEIYVVDTGILPTHTEFENRATDYYDAYDGGDGIDCHGHGTHCAGTAAGKTYGVAAQANVFGVRVFGCSGSGSLSNILDGISYVADTTIGKNVVLSMSIGGSFSQTMNDLIDKVVLDGDVVVVAAGNEFQDACRKSPSSAPLAITVGATEKVNDRKAAYSNHGPCLDIFAPGSSIKSAWIGSDTATATISGTSMAAPHVAGGAAVLMEQGIVSDQVLNYLQSTATKDAIDMGTLGADDSPNLLLYLE